MKLSKIILIAVVLMSLSAFLAGKLSRAKGEQPTSASIYDFVVKSLDGKDVRLEDFKGKKLLIVNTASKCGKTPQYADLQKLHEQYGDKVTVLGFPANNFLWQEPGSAADIAEFCERNYGVTFQMCEKISVRGGDKHPLYKWLEAKTGEVPDWNFAKFVVSEDGTKVTFFKSGVKPLDPVILAAIK
jgi:glutathione peroxidase